MMQLRFTFIMWLALAFVFLVFHPVQADNPMPFQQRGVVDAVHPQQRRVVINDQTYRSTPGIPVYALTQRNLKQPPEKRKRLGLGALRPGMRIGFVTERLPNARRQQLVEIWILQRGTLLAEIREQSKASLQNQHNLQQ
jgi:hypothetical protein